MRDTVSQSASSAGMAQSPPGHSRLSRLSVKTPSPSAAQKVPNVASSRPTA
jgi:hypothetical protein